MGQARDEVPEPLRRLGVTRREATVLAEVADRRRNPEIAERLVVSVRTVESHLASLLRKLAVTDRAALMARANELLASTATPLPSPSTSFVGRHRELETVGAALAEHRLVTLVGPGGAGKTRLALHVAEQAVDDPTARNGGGPARFADLTGAASDEVASVLADALGVRDEARAPGLSWEQAVREQQGLLVVDNCEHVIEVAARRVDELLGAAKGLRVLATSREALRIPREHVVAVTMLVEADELFVQRARAAEPTFRRTADNTEQILELCDRLDRLPLAVELAAARVATFDIDEILAQLDDRFSLLVDGPRTADARQRTLEAALDWSHGLLEPPEQLLLHRLGVFPGSFSWDAALATCIDEELDRGALLTSLPRLVDKSLVTTLRGGRARRYRLTETVRLYARQRAPQDGRVSDRHAAHFLELATLAAPELRTQSQQEWVVRLEAEQANLVAALDWLTTSGTADDALQLATALAGFWIDTGRTLDARTWMQRALERADGAAPDVHARARIAASVLSRTVDVGQSREHAQVALDLANEDDLPLAQAAMGWALAYDGERVEAATHLRRALEGLSNAEADGDAWDRATVLQGLALATPELPEALELARRSRELFAVAGDRRREANTLYTMASRALDSGVTASDVRGWLAESLELATLAESAHDLAHAQLGLARLSWARGADDDVGHLLTQCLPPLRQLGDLRCVGRALLLSAEVAGSVGDRPGQARLLRQCLEAAEPAADHQTVAAAKERQADAG